MNHPGRSNSGSRKSDKLSFIPNSGSRKSDKHSFIPVPRYGNRLSSTDRPSEGGFKRQGQSIERSKSTLSTAGRQSRDALPSASKYQLNRRTKSAQQGEPRTPIMGKQTYSMTPSRTPSGDCGGRNWKKSLERAQAYVVVKDKRPITSSEWQKSETLRVSETLPILFAENDSECLDLIKPLTITRFVAIVSKLLSLVFTISGKQQIVNTNYVENLPRFTKRLLYPGIVSKSWLKTVNTLHTYPNALALISYIMDIVCRFKAVCSPEWLFPNNDYIYLLEREYLLTAWDLFQNSKQEDLEASMQLYMEKFREYIGVHPESINNVVMEIEDIKRCLAEPAHVAAREDVERREERNANIAATMNHINTSIIQKRADIENMQQSSYDLSVKVEELTKSINQLKVEIDLMRQQVEQQSMSVEDRKSILEKITFSETVYQSKLELIEKVSDMLARRDKDLSRCQKEAMDACVQYNQRVITLSNSYDCKNLQIQERQLICESTMSQLKLAVESFRQLAAESHEKLLEQQRSKDLKQRRISQRFNVLSKLKARCEELENVLEQARDKARTRRQDIDDQTVELQKKIREKQDLPFKLCHSAQKITEEVSKLYQKKLENDILWKSCLAGLEQDVKAKEVYLAEVLGKEKEKRLFAAKVLIQKWDNTLDEK